MAARAIWKGVVRFEDVELPVKLYSAVQDRNIHFRLLHDQDQSRLKQRMVNPKTGRDVPREDVQRGYQLEQDLLVKLDDEELQSLQPEDSRDIEITCFVDPEKINHQWYVRPYYLGPDGNETDYFAFSAALAHQQKEGVARWVMRKKRYLGALRARGDYLMLITLRHASEVITASEVPPPAGKKVEPKEEKLAELLISNLEQPFEPIEFHDEYRDRVMELIEAKRQGRKIELKEPEEKPKPKSIRRLLEASLGGS